MNEFDELVGIVKKLREECPWDMEQTHESLSRHLIEEAYELLDSLASIEEKDSNDFYLKYNPEISSDIKIFSFLQLIFTGTVSTSVLFFLSQITYNEIFIYAIAITALSSMTGLLLEGKKYMYFVILMFSVLGILSIEFFGVLNINLLSTTLLSSQLYVNILLVCLVYIYQSYQGFSAAKVR